jgi:integrative and conjugative element protein (TIGR02256 family)
MVMRFAKKDDAMIAVWHRDTETGAVSAYTVQTYKESMHSVGEFSVYIDDGLEAELRAMRIARLPNETGGILLGYHDLSLKTIVIVKACPAPPDSVGTPISFVRGTGDVAKGVENASARTANIVGYIGEWHTHPHGHTANASRDDVVQLVGLTLSMVEDGLPALQLIVGETDINILIGQSTK